MYGNVLTYLGIILSIGIRYISMGSNIICTEIGFYHIIMFVLFSKILKYKKTIYSSNNKCSIGFTIRYFNLNVVLAVFL